MPAGPELVVLGVLGAPHGLRGELRVRFHNPDSELLQQGLSVVLRGEGRLDEAQLRSLRREPKGWVVRLSGCDDRTRAEALAGAELCVLRSLLPVPDDDEFYLCDLVGLEVKDASGERVGRVENVIGYPASEVACVRTSRGLLEVPLVEPYLTAANPAEGELVVDHLDDLDPVREKG